MDENFHARSFEPNRQLSSDEDIRIVKEVPPIPTTERSSSSGKRRNESDSSDSESYTILKKMFKRFVRRERILGMNRLSSSGTEEEYDRPRRSRDRISEMPSSSDRRYKKRNRNTSSSSESRSIPMRRTHRNAFRKGTSSPNRSSSSGTEEEFEQPNRYPSVPVGVTRQIVNAEAYIQHCVEETHFPPCPGLEHVVEIRGISQLSYFCNFCSLLFKESEIVNHLRSHKHQLNCLKDLREDAYNELFHVPKDYRRKYVLNILSYIQNNEGIGKVTVEKEYLTRRNYYDTERNTLSHQDILGSNPGYSRSTHYQASTAVDISKSQYFCLVCECNLAESKIWKSHTEGRYLTTVKKQPRSRIEETQAFHMPNENAFLIYRLDDATGPVVGLDFIREIKHKKDDKESCHDDKESYHCFLCRQCVTCIDIIEHLTTQKHRMNYLEEIDHDSLDFVRRLDFNLNSSHYQLEEICKRVLINIGPGKPEVYVVKNKKDC